MNSKLQLFLPNVKILL